MSTIIETALEAVGKPVPAKYQAVAQRVQAALEAREAAIFGNLVEAGVGFGLTRDQVHGALVKAGLTAPAEVEADDATVLAELVRKVEDAIAWARTKGYRG